jgi:hypothetical protein
MVVGVVTLGKRLVNLTGEVPLRPLAVRAAAVSQRISRRRKPRQRVRIRTRGFIRLVNFHPVNPGLQRQIVCEVWDHSRSGVVRGWPSDERKNLIFSSPETTVQKLKVSCCVEGSPNDPSVLCYAWTSTRPVFSANTKAKKHGQAAGRPEGGGYQNVGWPTWPRNVKCIHSPDVLTIG